ncbi:MAG: hypothetical protein WKG32_15195 [Gemmatimonadaceae bacterium]
MTRPASRPRPVLALGLLALALAPLATCTDAPNEPRRAADSSFTSASAVVAPPGASVSTPVTVPSGMATSPFNVARALNLPPGFSIAVYARVSGARFMAVAPNGDLLVSQPGAGKVVLVRPNGTGAPIISDFITGLRNPHDLVFYSAAGVTYVYVAESHQINRYVYTSGATTPGARQVVVANLPDASTPELNGNYGHQLKNIALDGNGKLYVSIASTCNVCTSDTQSDPVRAAIYQYNADGSGGRLFARGLRNAEGLAIIPGTNTLWVAVNNRDNVPYPYNDASGNYGRVLTSYVDDHPPEEFTRVRDGGNYGWPFCNPTPDSPSGYDDMPFDRDYDTNANGAVDCATMDRINKGIQAHSAPLGLLFLQNTSFTAAYRDGAAIALHGSWNRSVKTGYKIAFFPWDAATQLPGAQVDLVTGWADASSQWGRPVDVAVDAQGAMLISDDYANAIYKLTANSPPPPPPPTQSVTSFTLINADTEQPIAGYDPIAEGAQLNLASLPTQNLNIRANTNPSPVGSVRFAYDANANYRTENSVPYALAGTTSGGTNYNAWTPTVGSHTLTATPYSTANAGGTAGTAKTLHFSVKKKGR